jgi:hypothetical protein
MKIDEPEPMKEIHRIREKLYEETKHMSSEEQIVRTRENVKKLTAEYNLKLREFEKSRL